MKLCVGHRTSGCTTYIYAGRVSAATWCLNIRRTDGGTGKANAAPDESVSVRSS